MNLLDSMRVFSKLAETTSFTRTAEHLGLPKATVSGAIQNLEERLGTRLFNRTTRTVKLTQDGLSFYERCKDTLSDVDELETMFKAGTKKVGGRIRIDMSAGLARSVVIPRLPEFLEQYPNIEIELNATDRKVNVITEGFDLVIRAGTSAESGLIARKIAEFEMVNCASRDYVKKFGKPKTLEDLRKHQIVDYVPNLGTKSEGFDYWDGEKTIDIPVQGSITVNNVDSYLSACLAGLGIIQMPSVTVQKYFASGELVEILPNYQSKAMPICLVYPHRRLLAQRVQIFMGWVTQAIQDHLDKFQK